MAGGRPKKDQDKKCVRQNITMEPDQLERLIVYCQRVIRKALEKYLDEAA